VIIPYCVVMGVVPQVSYIVVCFPGLVVLVYTLCTKSLEMFQVVEMCLRVVTLCDMCVVAWY
jgi:hypothetical protein